MIKFVQRAIKSWVMKVFLGLLVASFAVFGIGDVFTASLGSSVMSVGNQKIDAQTFLTQFENERRAASQRFGQPVDVALARQLGLEAQVISRLAAEATLDQQMEDMSISAPDEAVSNIVVNDPSFRGANGFDEDTYKYLIAQSGFTVEGYEASTRKALARNQFTAALMAGATAPNGAAEAIFAYNGEQRRFDFVVLNIAEHAEDPGQPTDADLTAFHSENEALFQAPELRDAVYIHLDLEEMAKGYGVDDAEVRALYDNRLAFYAQPERRALYQMLGSPRFRKISPTPMIGPPTPSVGEPSKTDTRVR
ncbi:MAG: SurA N-terminal domain-containing protein, partial [Pseudomonadota bacterium]